MREVDLFLFDLGLCECFVWVLIQEYAFKSKYSRQERERLRDGDMFGDNQDKNTEIAKPE